MFGPVPSWSHSPQSGSDQSDNTIDTCILFVQALGATIQYGSPKPLDEGLPTLAQRACDSTPSVRAGLTEVVGNWLLDLPDRYVFHVSTVC